MAGLTRAVLDTSVLLAADVPPLDGDLAVSAASLAELHFGALITRDQATRAERLRRLAIIENRFAAPLPIDAEVARSYGHLASKVARAGRRPRARVMDVLIAATAHANQAALYTRNPADLRGIEDLVDIRAV
jgi:toxin FitB